MWAFVSECVPFYPVYALFFRDSGLGTAEISTLFAVWSTVALVAEAPSGALADRFSRRGSLAAAGVLQAGAYACWVVAPTFVGFALGFALWGLGGSFVSGAQEALAYDTLAEQGAEDSLDALIGRLRALALVAQVPATGAAALLVGVGGYAAAGWASVAVCLLAAGLALRLREPARSGPADDDAGYWRALRDGLGEVRGRPRVRAAVLALALVGGLDAIEEYHGLLAGDRGVPDTLVPPVVLAVTLAGAAGACAGGRSVRVGSGALLLALSAGGLGLAGVLPGWPALALLALSYAGYQAVLVPLSARLQQTIESSSRATVTSVASLIEEGSVYAVYLGWTLAGPLGAGVVVLAVALALPALQRRSAQPGGAGRSRTQ